LGATRLERQNLANITKGQFEGMAAQIKSFNDFMNRGYAAQLAKG
jgi:glutamate formiminotransferase